MIPRNGIIDPNDLLIWQAEEEFGVIYDTPPPQAVARTLAPQNTAVYNTPVRQGNTRDNTQVYMNAMYTQGFGTEAASRNEQGLVSARDYAEARGATVHWLRNRSVNGVTYADATLTTRDGISTVITGRVWDGRLMYDRAALDNLLNQGVAIDRDWYSDDLGRTGNTQQDSFARDEMLWNAQEQQVNAEAQLQNSPTTTPRDAWEFGVGYQNDGFKVNWYGAEEGSASNRASAIEILRQEGLNRVHDRARQNNNTSLGATTSRDISVRPVEDFLLSPSDVYNYSVVGAGRIFNRAMENQQSALDEFAQYAIRPSYGPRKQAMIGRQINNAQTQINATQALGNRALGYLSNAGLLFDVGLGVFDNVQAGDPGSRIATDAVVNTLISGGSSAAASGVAKMLGLAGGPAVAAAIGAGVIVSALTDGITINDQTFREFVQDKAHQLYEAWVDTNTQQALISAQLRLPPPPPIRGW